MGIVGPNGRPIGADNKTFRLGDFEIASPKPANFFLGHALQVARDALRQSNPMAAMQVSNPFQMEPAAKAVFMMAAEELSKMTQRLEALEARVEELEHGKVDGKSGWSQ